MFVFENNVFTEREDLNTIYETIFDEQDDMDKALGAIGFTKTAQYYHKNDHEEMGVEVNSRISKDVSAISKDYEFFVDWYCYGEWNGVLIKNRLDLHDFLGKYLPIIKLAGDLSEEECQ